MGGACQACDLFCHMCACKRYGADPRLMAWKEGHLQCRRFCLCCENAPVKCYHWEVDDEVEIDRKKQMICVHLLHDKLRCFRLMPEYLQKNILHPSRIKIYFSVNPKFPDYQVEEDPAVKARTRIKTSVTDANWYNDAAHIDFKCPQNSSQVRTAHSSLLDNELILQKMYY